MNTVSTQTYTTSESSTQVNNINLIINEQNIHPLYQMDCRNSFDCVYNKIIKEYHKKINEEGHSILNWRDYDKIHSKIAKETIQELTNANIQVPYWLISRANKYNNK